MEKEKSCVDGRKVGRKGVDKVSEFLILSFDF